MSKFTEDVVEQATLEWFEELNYQVVHGPDIAPGEPGEERASYEDVILKGRLEEAAWRLNPDVEPEAVEEALRQVYRISSPMLVDGNHHFHHLLDNGIPTEFLRADLPQPPRSRLASCPAPMSWAALPRG